jgi:hypothetical protein
MGSLYGCAYAVIERLPWRQIVPIEEHVVAFVLESESQTLGKVAFGVSVRQEDPHRSGHVSRAESRCHRPDDMNADGASWNPPEMRPRSCTAIPMSATRPTPHGEIELFLDRPSNFAFAGPAVAGGSGSSVHSFASRSAISDRGVLPSLGQTFCSGQ